MITLKDTSQQVVVASQDSFIAVHAFDDDTNAIDKSDEVSILSEDNQVSIENAEVLGLVSIQAESTDSESDITAQSEYIYRKGYSPYWNEETQTWWEYSEDLSRFIDTGVSTTNVVPIPNSEIDALWYVKEYADG